ncbi:MAG: heme ABC transporter ATP-binding protein [Chitinophagaceae bacterium]|nr:heme ABC transporter ATP-binding protein [Chitinophagaceae bacterium]
MLQAAHISFKNSHRYLLHNVSFEVKAGEVLSVLGANGAGKSTLLKNISGELQPHKGTLIFKNKPLHSWKNHELARQRGVLSQHYQVSLPFTSFQIAMMGRYPHFKNHPLPNDHDIVKQCLCFSGIEHLADRNYLTLSGGEQQRVQIARVLAQLWDDASTDKLLLLDEPVSALDIQYQHHIMQLIRKLAVRGFAIISVVHDLNLALQYSDRILLLKNGTQVAFGDTALLNKQHIKEVYGVESELIAHPVENRKYIIITE